ncbi:MAG TPA: CHAT domain-containing protein [Xenococcaceae cyanobacterium]
MKLIHHLISLSVVCSWAIVNSSFVRSQTVNCSDCFPNVIELIPPQTPEPTPEPVVETPTTTPEPTPEPVVETPTPTPEPTPEPAVGETPTQTPDTTETITGETPETTPEPGVGENSTGSETTNSAPTNEAETVREILEPETPEATPEPGVGENSAGSEAETVRQVLEAEETNSTNISETEVDVDGELNTDNNNPETTEAEVETSETDKTITDETETQVTEETDSEATSTEEKTETQDEETVVQEEETEETAEAETEETAEESDFESKIDAQAYELQLQQSSPEVAVLMQEESYATQLASYSDVQMYGEAPSVEQISQRLGELWKQTGKKAAFINVSLQKNQLESFAVLPSIDPQYANNSQLASNNISQNQLVQPEELTLRSTVENTPRTSLLATAKQFRQEISNPRKVRQDDYLASAQQLYKLIIEPIEAELEANEIDILVFAMDSGLRLLPLAALHDGEQFLIEKYAVALVPSFGLTDTRYVNLSQGSILAMGASEFRGEQAALPTMPIELESITRNSSRGEIYLNEDFTVANFKAQNRRRQPFSIIHLGTHAQFKAGRFSDSYIQFYDQKLQLSALRELSDELGWSSSDNPPVELLVLSACQTALGDENAELGFAGLAVQTGVKSALASLWYVSDLGTLALMGEFYDRLDDTLIKAEALRQTQLKMLTGEVTADAGNIKLSNGELLPLPADFPKGNLSFSHPYFWSSFTLIGNWN